MVIKILRRILHLLGYDLIKSNKKVAEDTLLGLKHLPVKSVVDIGSNIGQFANYVRNIFPAATIYTFEPLPQVFEQLQTWCKKDNNAFAYNIALGEFKGFTSIKVHTEHNSSSSLLQTTDFTENYYPFTKQQNTVEIEIDTLNNWEKAYNVKLVEPFIVKIDVQGYEDRVIKGGKDVLKKATAIILEINIEGLYEEQATYKELSDLLYQLGFQYAGNFKQTVGNNGHIIDIDAVFIKKEHTK